MAKPVLMQYNADRDKAMSALAAGIGRLGYTVKTANTEQGSITFETGISLWSLGGQSMSARVEEVRDGVQIAIGGRKQGLGRYLQAYDWGESGKIARKVFDQIRTDLGPGQWISGSMYGAGRTALASLLFVGLFVLVLMLIAMAL
jgi:hypothetical protein